MICFLTDVKVEQLQTINLLLTQIGLKTVNLKSKILFILKYLNFISDLNLIFKIKIGQLLRIDRFCILYRCIKLSVV